MDKNRKKKEEGRRKMTYGAKCKGKDQIEMIESVLRA